MPLVKITLSTPLARDARHQAAEAGLPLERWLGEVVESYLANERCQHDGTNTAVTPKRDADAAAADE
jgi:hypothetical protein